MKEKEFINIITNTLASKYIGDDCAYLKDLDIVITQDNLVEGVHFSMHTTTPYKLGYKSVMVNISDVAASGAEPKYLTIALSLPDFIDENFIQEFYKGAKDAAKNCKIVGGDITGADKIFVSVAAIGSTKGRNISSRNKAKSGQKIVISGEHGSSAAGLNILSGTNYPKLNEQEKEVLIKAHLMPEAQIEFSKYISTKQSGNYAMMDTSDGLADALFTISEQSKVLLDVDFEKIPHNPALEKINNYKDLILYGGEDYGLVATVDKVPPNVTVIGEVKTGAGIKLNYNGYSELLSKKDIEKNLYKHFKE